MKPFQFLTIRPALIIGVQFKLQNLYYFGLSATNFPSLDVKILTTSVWVRHLFPHWTCRRVEEISNAPRVRNILVYSSREDLEIFGSSEIGLLSRVWGLCALQCDPVSSIWAGIPSKCSVILVLPTMDILLKRVHDNVRVLLCIFSVAPPNLYLEVSTLRPHLWNLWPAVWLWISPFYADNLIILKAQTEIGNFFYTEWKDI